jgi:hypothetical protein
MEKYGWRGSMKEIIVRIQKLSCKTTLTTREMKAFRKICKRQLEANNLLDFTQASLEIPGMTPDQLEAIWQRQELLSEFHSKL